MMYNEKEEAVSPVIGVILIVAITVILAAVIAVFVFSMAGSVPRTATQCTVSNESALEAAWIDGYRTGISRARVGNDTGWSWNYSVPECIP